MADEKTPAREQVSLLTAPKGWTYSVTLTAEDGRTMAINPSGDKYEVLAKNGDDVDSTTVGTLKEGVRAAVDAVKHMNQVEERRLALEADEKRGLFGAPRATKKTAQPAAQKPPATTVLPEAKSVGSDSREQPALA